MITVKSNTEVKFRESFVREYAWVELWAKFKVSDGRYVSSFLQKDVRLNFLDKIRGITLKDKTEKALKVFSKKAESKRLQLENEINSIREIVIK